MKIISNMFLIFAAFFFLPVIFMSGEIIELYSYNGILKNGIEVEAEVIKNSMSSNVSSNGESFYSVGFVFVDENGVEHKDRTSQSYTYEHAKLIMEGEIILIKYDPNNFNAIESSYDPSIDKGGKTTKVLFYVFLAVDGVLWAIGITSLVKQIKRKRIAKNGTKYTAEVLSIDTNVRVNGVEMYTITFTWTGENGEMVDTSPASYRFEQAYALQLQKRIEIKAVGNKGVIISTPDLNYLKKSPNQINY